MKAERTAPIPMLRIVPHRWFSWDFTVSQGSQAVAEIDISWWRERGELTVQGARFRVSRQGMMSGDFLLESDRGVVARATKPSVMRRLFVVQHEAKTYTLRARSVLGRSFVLLDAEREVGTIAPAGVWSRRADVDLPAEIPLPVQVFLIWLAVLMWKREADSASGAS
jgi:hypothetical protein